MIYTVTFNPAIDYVVRLDAPLEVGQVNRACGEDCTVTLDFLNFQTVRHGDRNIFAQCREVIQIDRYAFRRNSRRHAARERLSACGGGHAVCDRVAGDPHAAGKTHAAALDLRLINRAIAGDRRRLAGGHAVDRRIRGGGNRGFGIQLQMIDIRIQRQRNLLIAVYFYIREAFIAWGGQLFLVEHRCAADLRVRKTSGACRSNLQQATHRRGHNDVVAHCIRHCYRAAGYDDRTLDVHVIQLYRIRGKTFGQVFKTDFSGVGILNFFAVMFSFLFVDLFDTLGTLIGVASKADMLDEDGKLPRIKGALMADAVATSVGAVLGTSTTTTYVESSSGVTVGGRTGLTATTTAVLFLLASIFSPLFLTIPSFATAPALIVVGFYMMGAVAKINFDDMTDAIPAFLTILVMPLAYSISEGIAIGIISWTLINVLTGKAKEKKITPLMYVLTVLFILKYIFL